MAVSETPRDVLHEALHRLEELVNVAVAVRQQSMLIGRWTWTEFALDSALEESGFEPLVPLATKMLIELARGMLNANRMLAVCEIGPVPRLC